MYLLDTNAISELRKYLKGTADDGFTNWIFQLVKASFLSMTSFC